MKTMKQSVQMINAYLNGELEECELLSFNDEVQSDPELEAIVSYEVLGMLREERNYRINELNSLNGGVTVSHSQRNKKSKAHNPTSILLKLLRNIK